ncbi:hypothetical protein CEXT_379601 [Caerostris extrusa]|uniref:Uncharacterized protein n=1 Tax=Caerostris extrusa TaxID=172846 RepID=A0AAV4VG97_CAEEX|nr:hypothetical protein CEXT_379601 [Caerostris extrusa]
MKLTITPDPSEECFQYLRNRLRCSLQKGRGEKSEDQGHGHHGNQHLASSDRTYICNIPLVGSRALGCLSGWSCQEVSLSLFLLVIRFITFELSHPVFLNHSMTLSSPFRKRRIRSSVKDNKSGKLPFLPSKPKLKLVLRFYDEL